MKTLGFIKVKRIVPDIKADRWTDALNEMIDGEGSPIEVKNRQVLMTDLIFRENLASTCVGHGIAVPHAVTEGVENCLVIFGRSRRGIRFGQDNRDEANFIFIVAVPPRQQFKSLRVMKDILTFMNDDLVRKALLEALSVEGIKDIFRRGPTPAGKKPIQIMQGIRHLLSGHPGRHTI